MKRILKLSLMSASAIAIGTASASADYELEIIHINDLHSRIESINAFDSTCSAEDETEGKCFGGVARLVTAAEQARERVGDGNLLFLNAGDNFQGSLFYTTYKGEVEAEFLNKMGTDVMTIGNHEFDDGEDALAPFLDKIEFPVVSANVVADDASKIREKVKPYVVIEKGGEKIGIVGAVANDTNELSSPGEHVMIAEDVEKITEAVKALAGEGVNKIIALTHVGYPRDLAAIAKIPGVDVVVGGHTNTLLSNSVEDAAGPYPTWVDNPVGYKVPVVQAYAYSKYLGDLKVTFSDIGIVEDASGDLIAMDSSVTPDQESLDRIKELGAPIEELKAKVIGETADAIEGNRDVCRAMECSMGNLVADAMLDRVKDQGMQIAIQNGGGLRASIDSGEMTMGEVLTVLPFQNTLATFELKGSGVVAALENGVSQIADGAGRFPQVSGLKFTFDAEAEPGSRVSDVMVETSEGNFEPIDPEATYGVVSNNFMRAGGDGYTMFAEDGMNAYDYGPGVEQVVADYIAANSPYKPYTDGRIQMAKAMEGDAAAEKPAEGDTAMEKPAEGDTGLAAEGGDTGMKTEGGDTGAKPADGGDTGMKAADGGDTGAKPADGGDTGMKAADGGDTGMKPADGDTGTSAESGDMEKSATEEAEVAVPETGLAAGALSSEAPMVDTGEATTMDKAEGESMEGTEARKHVVVAGDNFWDLADEYYDDPKMYTKIEEANPGTRAKGLQIGMELVIPN